METKISSRHMELTTALEDYAKLKADKFHKYFDRIQQVEVIIAKDRHEYITEFIIDVEHHQPIIATASHQDLYASIDLGADKSIRQLSDHKSRLRDNKHHTPASGVES